MLTFFFRAFALAFCCHFSLGAQDFLKSSDVHAVMQKILEQHISKKNLTSQMIQTSVSNYIEQFDPDHIYLLESEASPFLHLSPAQLKAAIQQYDQGEFPLFRQLNDLIQKSILRSRGIRKEIEEKNREEVFQKIQKPTFDEKKFAHNEEELRARIVANLSEFVEEKKQRYGSAMSAKMRDKILYAYEAYLRETEDQYLYKNEKGEAFSPQEKENIFTIHVLKALTSSLDSHTSFYQDSEAYDLRLRLQKEFQGIGLVLKDNREGIKVIKLLPEGPAEKNGRIKEGDLLVAVNEEKITALPFEKVMEKLHGEKNTPVRLTFTRENAPYSVELQREVITIKSDRVDVSTQPFGYGILGKITLHSFYQGDGLSAEKDVIEAIQKLQAKGNLRGLILDLRDNSGGFLSQAVKVAGLFITNGVIVISKYSNGEERFYRDVDGKTYYDGPLIVLTSKITASAAEIVAQALQDYGVALVVGDAHTYGKGTIQTQTVTDNQSANYFKVTVGKYYTVSGTTPQKQGVKADVIVPGHWSRQKVGEVSPDAIEGGKIAPVFEDDFSDVSPDVRGWYLKYYTPTIQRPLSLWRDLIPKLKKNSESRIEKNKNYQLFLKGKIPSDLSDDEDEGFSGKNQGFGEDDLQLQEAFNVLKDMVFLQNIDQEKKKS